MKSFSENYTPFIDRWGLVQPEPGTTSDNGVRFSTESILAALVEDKKKLGNGPELSLFIGDRLKAIKLCTTQPGLLSRYPGCETQDGPDNYYAAAFVGYMFDRNFAKAMYYHGLRNYGVFKNNPNSSVFAKSNNPFLWRQPALYAHMKHCAGYKLNILEQLAVCLGLYLSSNSKDQDPKMLMVFVVEAFKGHYSLIDRAIDRWKRKLKEHYERGVGGVLSAYYHPLHGEHPNAQYLLDYFC